MDSDPSSPRSFYELAFVKPPDVCGTRIAAGDAPVGVRYVVILHRLHPATTRHSLRLLVLAASV